MPNSGEILYAFRIETPDWLERGRNQVVEMKAYRDGVLVAPSALSTFALYAPNGVAMVVPTVVTIVANVATFTILASSIPATTALGDGWREEWHLAMPDNTTRTVSRPAGMSRRLLYPMVTYEQLLRRHRDLPTVLPPTDPYGQAYLDDAWASIETRLVARGNRPYLVMDPSAFTECLTVLALGRIFDDAQTSLGAGKYERMAERYARDFETVWNLLTFEYDIDNDGTRDSADQRAAEPMLWTNRAPSGWRGNTGGPGGFH